MTVTLGPGWPLGTARAALCRVSPDAMGAAKVREPRPLATAASANLEPTVTT
jgi:hypothetical protein